MKLVEALAPVCTISFSIWLSGSMTVTKVLLTFWVVQDTVPLYKQVSVWGVKLPILIVPEGVGLPQLSAGGVMLLVSKKTLPSSVL